LTVEEKNMLLGHLALVVAAVFSGAAIYVSLVEGPARLTLDDRAALAEWQPAYKRGTAMQASLAAAASAIGLAAWWQMHANPYLVGAVLALLPWPWTLLVIMPTNKALLALGPSSAGPESRRLLRRWDRLHLMRTALGVAATASYLWGTLTPQSVL
jgi:hypothetical protein